MNKYEKSLRWICRCIPDCGKSKEAQMLNTIRYYCEKAADEISRLEAENFELKKNAEMHVR